LTYISAAIHLRKCLQAKYTLNQDTVIFKTSGHFSCKRSVWNS